MAGEVLFILLGFRYGWPGGQVACELVTGFYGEGGEALASREGGVVEGRAYGYSRGFG